MVPSSPAVGRRSCQCESGTNAHVAVFCRQFDAAVHSQHNRPNAGTHRKQLTHFNEPGYLHFMTFSYYQRKSLLTNDLFRTWLARALDKAFVAHAFQLSGFVFMPEPRRRAFRSEEHTS